MIGIIIITLLALVFGIILINLEKMFSKDSSEIETLLPGYNCGACGYKGCSDLAEKIFESPELYKKCKVLKGDNLVKMQNYLKEKYGVDNK